MFHGRFRPDLSFVVVRRIRLSSDSFLEPGECLLPDKEKGHSFPIFAMRRWFKRRFIGIKDSDWAEEMLNHPDKTMHRPETRSLKIEKEIALRKSKQQSVEKSGKIENPESYSKSPEPWSKGKKGKGSNKGSKNANFTR